MRLVGGPRAPLLNHSNGAEASSLLLDGYTTGVVYSFRRLLSAYEGDCVRIRRSSDDAEQDFGFVDDVVDTAGIASFIGGGNGFIKTFYDQGGGGIDVTNATADQQPQYIASGINGLPTARFDGSNDNLQSASSSASSLSSAQEQVVMSVIKQDGSQTNGCVITSVGGGGNSELAVLATFSDIIYYAFDGFGGGYIQTSQPSGWDDNPHVLECYRTTGDNQVIAVDGTSLNSESKSTTFNTSDTITVIFGASLSSAFKGDISEIINLKVEGSSQRDAIRADQGNYYDITLA